MRPSIVTAIGTLLIAVIGLVGCGDVTSLAPTPGIEATDVDNPVDTVVEVATDTTPAGAIVPVNTLQHSAAAPPLMTTDTTFVMLQGEERTFRLHYSDPGRGWWWLMPWFMEITIPSDAQFVDSTGVPLTQGDTVRITTQVDPTHLFVQFGPHGSTFDGEQPAQVRFNTFYLWMSGYRISDLVVWYQETVGDVWTLQQPVLEQWGALIVIDIHHFSNYAVAW